MPPAPALSALSRPELEVLLVELFAEVASLKQTVAEQREEIARLKGVKGRPNIKPSGMDKGSAPARPTKNEKRHGRGKVMPRVGIEEKVINAEIPPGSRFKGYQSFLVQDLVISVRATRYQRERWVTPDGRTILAPLPEGIEGHFGPELRRFVLMQYHQGQSTMPRLLALLCSMGLVISKRQLVRLLNENHEGFIAEAQDVLRAGLETSPWVTVDDTGARHAGKNGFCTQIGNEWFTWFRTRSSKSRLNFLDLLRAGYTDYVLNDAAYDYMRNQGLPAATIARLKAEPQTRFSDQTAWQAHLDRLGFNALKVTPEPVRVATEGALWGSVQAHEFLCDAVILSDDAGQFNIGRHALCWVHAERLVHRLDTFNDLHRAAQTRVRGLIWGLLRGPQGVSGETHQAPGVRVALAFRSPLPSPHRIRDAGSPAGAVARQQGGVADGAGTAGNPAAHQRLGERHSLSRHAAQDQRRNAERHRPRLPRRFPEPGQDLRQARDRGVGLPRQPVQGGGGRDH